MNIKLNQFKVIITFILSIIIFIWKVSAFEETININGLSWDYWKEDYNNYLVPIMSNIESNFNIEEYVKKIQTINQKWEDLNLYTIDNSWNIMHQTLMDRNMWATEIYNKKFNINEINTWSFWYHYQWWNKYGFTPCISLWGTCNTFPWWEIIAEKSLWNIIRTNFIWTFANNVWNNLYIIEDIPYENFSIWLIWYSHAPYSKRIRQQMGENLWWWYWDTKTSNGNGSFEWQDILDNTIQSHANRQWPCPNNYHIPSVAERNEIFTSWANARRFSSTINENTFEEIFWEQFSVDLLLPPAGIRGDNSNIQNQWIKGAYRSSSPMDYYVGDTYNNYRGPLARYLTISKSFLWIDNEEYSNYENGLSIRCIKNTNNQWIKIYPNWWTNAIIAIDWDKITTLSNPSRNWCTFGWRYTDPNFPEYSLISVWSEIYDDTTLHAKWIWENCWRTNTQQQNCTSLPKNAQWINSKFTQTWDGVSWTPSSHSNNYTSDINVECSFQCNTNYTRDSNSGKCVTNIQKTDCSWLPNNAQWINSKFTQTWNWGSRNPSSHENHYTSDSNVECSFQCNANYSRNSSSKSCEYNWSSWGWSWWGWGWSSWGWSSSKNNYISVSTNRKSPSTNQYINLTIETDDDYTDKIKFSKFQYRSSSSSSWSNISRTSSTYVSNYSSAWSNGYYKMTSSDYGYVTLKEIIKFKKSWYYRICVEDTNSNDACIQINVDTSSSSNNYNLSISASPSSPDTYEWIKLTVRTDDNYTGKIKFSKFQYKSNSSSSWSSISSRTSSTYVSDYSSDWSDGYYKMTSSDDGEVTLKNLVKFKKSGYYRIYVKDTDGNESYVQINVDTSSSSSSSNDDLEVKASPSSPDTYEWVKLTISTDRDYTGKIKFSKFQYKSSNSSSWSTISNTSSTYVSDYSSEWSNEYYKMTSSDKGEVTLKNLVKFKKSGYYRIYVEDTDGNESYVQINVDSSDSSSSSSSSESNDWNEFIDLINDLINWKTNQSTNNDSYDQNSNQNNNQSNNQNNNQNNIEPNQYSNNTYTIPNEIYVSRSCKPYNIQYVESLNAYTSPDLNKSEYFVNVEYFKRYIDSKNAQNAECFIWGWRINSSYVDTYTWNDHVTAPNGKIYFINENNWTFSSNQLNGAKSFSTINEIKTYIKNRNPLSKIN